MVSLFSVSNLRVDLEGFFLKDINIELENSEYLVILGKSGSGKTVFLESIAGRYNLCRGNINLFDEDISKIPPEKRSIGFVYQNYELFSHMKVRDNIGFPLKFNKTNKKDITYKVDEMMELLNISHLKDRYPAELSGGEKQRVAIGRVLVMSPKLILLDEPFSALDYVTKENVKEMLKDIHKKFKPIVIHVTHDIKEALYFADKIGIMKNNTISKMLDYNELKNIKEKDIYKYI